MNKFDKKHQQHILQFGQLLKDYLDAKDKTLFLKENPDGVSKYVSDLKQSAYLISTRVSLEFYEFVDDATSSGRLSEQQLNRLAENADTEAITGYAPIFGGTNSAIEDVIRIIESEIERQGYFQFYAEPLQMLGSSYLITAAKELKPETYKLLLLAIGCFLKCLPNAGSTLLMMAIYRFVDDVTQLQSHLDAANRANVVSEERAIEKKARFCRK